MKGEYKIISKIKPLLPSLKERNRYVAFEIISKDKIASFDSVSQAIWDSSINFLGELELGKAGLRMFKDSWEAGSQKAVLKVSHEYVNKIITSLSLVDEINKVPVMIHTLGTSGILKKSKKRYLAS